MILQEKFFDDQSSGYGVFDSICSVIFRASSKPCNFMLEKPTDIKLYNIYHMLEGAQLRKLRICPVSAGS